VTAALFASTFPLVPGRSDATVNFPKWIIPHVLAVMLGLVIVPTGTAQAASCGEMTKRLARLRLQYHEYASNSQNQRGDVTFEGLVEILDKIVHLKDEMRKLNCKVPPRPADYKGKE
jgi:hypothetical protein